MNKPFNFPQNDSSSTAAPVTVLGGGAWGTALAIQLARNNQPVRLWTNDAEQASVMADTRCNEGYLPKACRFPESLHVQADLAKALAGVKDIVIVVPSPVFCELLYRIKPYLSKKVKLIWGTKGFPVFDTPDKNPPSPLSSMALLHDSVSYCLGFPVSTAVLSGPSFAIEVAQGLPTAVVIASQEADIAAHWSKRFHSDRFRVYRSDDVLGVELGGILKNVIAVAVGAAAGLGMGANACSALITRGLVEMQRVGQVLGAKQETLVGLSGLGDLILTSTNDKSRNYRFGFALGSGLSVEQAKAAGGAVIESLNTVTKLCEFAKARQIDLPIVQQVKRLISDNIPAGDAMRCLLERAPASEF